jgi:hypothetical protein
MACQVSMISSHLQFKEQTTLALAAAPGPTGLSALRQTPVGDRQKRTPCALCRRLAQAGSGLQEIQGRRAGTRVNGLCSKADWRWPGERCSLANNPFRL